ncbi:MAG: 2-oxoacid:acceptor oxidoreductase subunit alpha [Deltaproteobacteria bacterium]|nr:2-oxoacid:acceptor oxidoreductase subunit alpha [Deltaproteobacteria bacterium]
MQDIHVIVAGAAGEGIQTIGDLLVRLAAAHGYAVFSWKEYESRIRGGQNRYAVRIGMEPVNAPLSEADILLALNKGALAKYEKLLKDNGIIISPEKDNRDRFLSIPFADIAKHEIGQTIYANTLAIGALVSALGMDLEITKGVVKNVFSKKGEDMIDKNIQALVEGFNRAGRECRDRCPWNLPLREDRYYVLTANEAIPMAAAYAGCRFISAYPMTPSTGIITFLAKEKDRLGVFVEQAEDEIAAVNMAIGASYAGARAMTATSGGGFALMVEGISLAGMTETPLVVVLAQRPGPATGLPTRTAQGDLLFAVNAGHGEFPKMVLAPSDPLDAFYKTVMAFNLADQYQTPVILLTDQFLADSHFSFKDFEPWDVTPKFHWAGTGNHNEYKRYRLTESGISPRLYPGQSKHLVCADSDEHNEYGHITEDLEKMAPAMAKKRMLKLDMLKKSVHPPEEVATKGADFILVSWGSTRGSVLEAISLMRGTGVKAGMIHFTELWPLPKYEFPRGKALYIVENNASGQLSRLLRSQYNISSRGFVHRFDGLPLTAGYIRRVYHEHNG